MAVGQSPTDEYMLGVARARLIHEVTGMVIQPWEVYQYPPDWMEAIRHLLVEVPLARIAINGGKP